MTLLGDCPPSSSGSRRRQITLGSEVAYIARDRVRTLASQIRQILMHPIA